MSPSKQPSQGDKLDDPDSASTNGAPKAAKDPNAHPLIGKRVQIVQGPFKGAKAAIVSIKSRGWWTLDHPEIEGVVHSRRCRLVDEVTEEDMERYYEKRGMKFRGTPVLKGIRKRDADRGSPINGDDAQRDAMLNAAARGGVALRTLRTLGGEFSRHIDKPALAASGDIHPHDSTSMPLYNQEHKRRKIGSFTKSWRDTDATVRMSDLVDGASNTKGARQFSHEKPRLGAQQLKPMQKGMLPPIVLDSSGRSDEVPEALSAFPVSMAIDIFDRKSGKVLEGQNAVKIRDLAETLRRFPEYEPIMPQEAISGSSR